MITIAERIEVPSPPDAVWKVLADPEHVVSCISGAKLQERHEDGSFDAALAVKFGGLRVGFKARATLDLEEEQMEGRLVARGADRQGATRVSSATTFRVQSSERAGASVVTIDGEVNLAGKLASVIDAGAGVVVARMTREFADALAIECAPEGSAMANGSMVDGSGSVPTRAPQRFGLLARVRRWFATTATRGRR